MAREGTASRPSPADRPAPSARESVAEHLEDATGELFGITELCQAFDISPRAIRFYEDKGLLSPRRVNGTRVYTRRDRARLALILRAKAIGATLAEIKHYLDMYGTHGEGRTQQLKYVLKRTDEALAELERKRRHLETLLGEVRFINDSVRAALAAKG